MRERGDLPGRGGGADDGATATVSVAACIWGGLRRRYAINSLPLSLLNPIERGTRPPVDYCLFGSSPFKSQTELSLQIIWNNSAERGAHGNHESTEKSKGPEKRSGPWVS